MESFISPLGCIVSVFKAPEHLGEGVLLNLRMSGPLDNRMAEVFLDTDSIEALRENLRITNE